MPSQLQDKCKQEISDTLWDNVFGAVGRDIASTSYRASWHLILALTGQALVALLVLTAHHRCWPVSRTADPRARRALSCLTCCYYNLSTSAVPHCSHLCFCICTFSVSEIELSLYGRSLHKTSNKSCFEARKILIPALLGPIFKTTLLCCCILVERYRLSSLFRRKWTSVRYYHETSY